ncbi:MAG: hemolysin family protein [Acidimicrobiales bacterium]
MTALITLLIILVMVGFNALYVAAEFATVGSRRSRVQESAESGGGRAKGLLGILQDAEKLDNYVAACQIGITLSSLIAGVYGQARLTPIFEQWLGSAGRGAAVIVVLLLITALQVVLGELLPKTVALRYPEALAMATLPPMRISQWLLRPLVVIFNGSAFWLMKRMGLDIDHSHSHVHSPQELAGLYRESAEGGLIDSAEREMLAGALRVSKRVVREIMTPRRRLITIDKDTPLPEALRELSASPYSRFPVTDGGEEVVGIVTLRDMFIANENTANEDAANKSTATVAEVTSEAMVVGEVYEVSPLLNTFSKEGIHAAIVVNEFGTISGLVTREDAIEEIFGEFNDEFDVEPDPITITGARVSIRGDVLLEVLNERFGLALPAEEVDTAGGYVWHHLGRLPTVGDEVPIVTVEGRTALESDGAAELPPPHPPLRVDSVDGTLVDRVSFELPDGSSRPEDGRQQDGGVSGGRS